MKVLARGLCLLALFLTSLAVHAEVAVPPLKARITDLTGTLSPSQRDTLERELQAFESRKGSQIAVLIVPTTQPEAIEQYSLRVAEAWKLGRKGIDDGVLLLVAKDDRELRIEVGYGLEGVIPDAVAKRVVSEIIIPFFKQGDFYGGIHAGVARLIRLVDGEPLPPLQARDNSWSGIFDYAPFIIIAAFVGGGMLRALFGRLIGGSVAGGVTGLILWFIAGSALMALIAGIVVFVLVMAAGVQLGPSRYGGWPGGGYGGGYGGGWSSGGGGGFSGGGGGFGGGGASGKW
ncbi:MAG TPA: YgcG family protein [Sulfuricaulis sp.]|nr:YgcG family protein [Sulfuricaulis sp.]